MEDLIEIGLRRIHRRKDIVEECARRLGEYAATDREMNTGQRKAVRDAADMLRGERG